MNRNDFLNMIENSVPVDRRMISEVYELIDIFPYFQSAHMLLLKGLQNSADVKFENQLRNSAIHIADREVLYYLLKTKPAPEAEPAKSVQDTAISGMSAFDKQQTVIETAKNSELLISEIEKDSAGTRSNEEKDTDILTSGHSILIATESEIDDSAGAILMMDEDSADSDDKVFFMDPGFSVPEHADLLELDTEEKGSVSLNETDIELLPPVAENVNSRKQLQSELIDKFIITNPRIEPAKEKISQPQEDISKPFVEENGGFVTETLARIYINQGYYSKAIDIYEKLSLKFPEKSSYFASQIEKVKEYIKK